MPLFRELRVKWSVFHRLLELTDRRMRYGTPDLPAILRRRRELLLGYSCLLEERGQFLSLTESILSNKVSTFSFRRCWLTASGKRLQ